MKGISICVVLCFLLISLFPTAISAQGNDDKSNDIVGFGPWKVYGLFPRVSDGAITCFLVLPFLRKVTLGLDRFSGHIGIVFLIGEYYWIANGPPALP